MTRSKNFYSIYVLSCSVNQKREQLIPETEIYAQPYNYVCEVKKFVGRDLGAKFVLKKQMDSSARVVIVKAAKIVSSTLYGLQRRYFAITLYHRIVNKIKGQKSCSYIENLLPFAK